MGQAGLAGPRMGPAADHAGGAGTGVRAAERALVEQAGGRNLGGEGMDLSHRDRLRLGERREEPGQAARQEGLAGTWRAEQEQVVAAGRGHLEAALGQLLTAHLLEVRRRHPCPAGAEGGRRGGPDRCGTQHVAHRLAQRTHGDDARRCERRGFARIGRRQQDLANAEPGTEVGDGKAAPHRPDGAVEAQLAAEQPPGQGRLRQMPLAGQQRESDRQVEMVALLAQVGRRQVDDHRQRIELEAAVADRGAHPLAAFPHRRVRQPDDVHLGQPMVSIDFHLDGAGLDPPGSGGCGAGEHPCLDRRKTAGRPARRSISYRDPRRPPIERAWAGG